MLQNNPLKLFGFIVIRIDFIQQQMYCSYTVTNNHVNLFKVWFAPTTISQFRFFNLNFISYHWKFFFSWSIATTNSLKVLRKFTIKSSINRAMYKQVFLCLNCAVVISLWNTFNHTFWVFNITKLSDWRKQAYLIQ